MTSQREGIFITLEGIEGAGKSTQTDLLERALSASGREALRTREPGGGGRVGDAMRALLKDPEIWRGLGLAEIFLYGAARAHHLESLVLPALARGVVVVCDRYLDSTLAYQGYGRGRPLDLIRRLHELGPLVLRPARTILLDVPPATGLARARSRANDGEPGYDEEDLSFFERVRGGFLDLARAEPERFRVVDADRDVGEVHDAIVSALRDLITGLAPAAGPR
jgi:dTMP kinase